MVSIKNHGAHTYNKTHTLTRNNLNSINTCPYGSTLNTGICMDDYVFGTVNITIKLTHSFFIYIYCIRMYGCQYIQIIIHIHTMFIHVRVCNKLFYVSASGLTEQLHAHKRRWVGRRKSNKIPGYICMTIIEKLNLHMRHMQITF